MNIFEIYKKLIFPEGKVKILLGILIITLLTFGYFIVLLTGGTAFAYLHILYVPIIFSGLIFSVHGGVFAGLIAGIFMSPLLQVNFSENTFSQPFSSWSFRMVIFILVGAIAGAGSSVFRAYIRELELKQTTDPLTRLPNLNGLIKSFTSFIQKTQKALIVIVVELDRMNEIDRAMGEERTDALIVQVAENLKSSVKDFGILGRLQSNRFAILVPNEENVPEILKECTALSEKAYHIGNIPLFVEMRFGVSRYPLDEKDLNNLIRVASIAINATKEQAQRISYFNKQKSDSSERNLLILHQLKKAIEEGSLLLEYQPKVYIQTGKVMGFEALVRWNDPILGPINPEDFIPLTEETLLINAFTKWLLEASLLQMHKWNKGGLLVPISINFSMKNLHDPSVIENLNFLIEKYRIPPPCVEIEVTETSVAANISETIKVLKKLREIGTRVTVDDFGTGQASQQYLFELPINVIKIDKMFVQSISHNPAAAAIVKNAISLGHDLHLEVVAEGVETRNQQELLKEWGCDIGQGYFYGKSLKEKEATAWLKKMLDTKD